MVKLRLRGVDGAEQQFSDLAMLVPVNLIKTKYSPVTCGERIDRPVQSDAVDGAGEMGITIAEFVSKR